MTAINFKYIFILIVSILSFAIIYQYFSKLNTNISGAPPYSEGDLEPPPESNLNSILLNWTRPDSPPKVGLQVGHWKNSELPDELERLRGNTGSTGGGKKEWEVNLKIAELTAELLKKEGIEVDILPSTVPKRYWADVFVAIHADGSLDYGTSGFKATHPRRDFTGNGERLLSFVEQEYEKATGLSKDPNVTRNMRGYYAFAWWRYKNAIHPMTTALILETGFLTSNKDRKIIVSAPEKSAEGLSAGIIEYLKSQSLL